MESNDKPLTADLFMELMNQQKNDIKTQIDSSAKSIIENTNTQLSAVVNTITEIQGTVAAHEKRMDEQGRTIEVQERQIGENSEKIKNLEVALRKKNLLFFGIQEIETNDEVLKDTISKLVSERSAVNLNPSDIEFLYRVGRKMNIDDKVRPVLVGFYSYAKKQSVLSIKSKVSPYGIAEDFPKEVIDARKKLAPQMQKFREEGKRVMFRVDKLIVNGKVWTEELSVREDQQNKRKLEDTPPNSSVNKRVAPNSTVVSISNVTSVPQHITDVVATRSPAPTTPSSTPSKNFPVVTTPSMNFPVFQLKRNVIKNTLTPLPGGKNNDKTFEYRAEDD